MSPSKRICFLASLLCCALLTPSSLWAAPKAGSAKRPATSGSSARVKYEYCYVVAGAYSGNQQGVAAYLPQGRKIFIRSSSDGYAAIAQMLNRLGDQGWQVVGFQDASSQSYTGQSWTLSRRK